MKNYALFIGNGLNRASTNNSAWADMLDRIREKYHVEGSEAYTNMPLEFERIYLDALKTGRINCVYEMKQNVAQFLPELKDLSLHKKFMELPVDSILTSNYDYFIEQSIDESFHRKNKCSNTNERKHSLFRHIHVNEKKVWHIHGESFCPDSICLGYNHYGTYLTRIIEYLTHPQMEISKKPLLRYIIENRQNRRFEDLWPIKFFTHHIFILGFTMSFLEIDIWWLLTYRMKFILENPHYALSNKIHYFYASSENTINDEQISLLESAGVILHPIPLIRNNWPKLYLTIHKKIGSLINEE